jgi:hypothetical protein
VHRCSLAAGRLRLVQTRAPIGQYPLAPRRDDKQIAVLLDVATNNEVQYLCFLFGIEGRCLSDIAENGNLFVRKHQGLQAGITPFAPRLFLAEFAISQNDTAASAARSVKVGNVPDRSGSGRDIRSMRRSVSKFVLYFRAVLRNVILAGPLGVYIKR